jgi:two-component system, OmpR family, alkaline phosphatase synthesis response regulator PhoP
MDTISRVLVVEDEQHLADGLRFNLEAEGYEATVADTGEGALELLAEHPNGFDVVVLDVMLPGKDGFTVMSELRAGGQYVPTLMLTARGRPEDVLKGFAAGADDYLTKPFELSILFARIRGLLRRRRWLETSMAPAASGSGPDASPLAPSPETPVISPQDTPQDPPKNPTQNSPINASTNPAAGAAPGSSVPLNPNPGANDRFVFGDKSVEFDALELRVREQVFPLTLMETNVLRYLIQHEGKPVSRKQMLEEVWGLHVDTDTRPIDNFIVRLRRYLEDDPTNPRHLLTVRGVGYRFIASPPET